MVIFKCDSCGMRYRPESNISYRFKHFCSLRCKEDFIDDEYKRNAIKNASQPPPAIVGDNVGAYDE